MESTTPKLAQVDSIAPVARVVPQPGDLIAGKYVMEREIGRGGMGVVLAARHPALHQRVAVKMLLPDALASSELVARFVREAQIVAGLRSEHVARVMDMGKLENGDPFLVMEYLEGKDMGAVLEEEARLSVTDAVDVVLQALDAVAEAHAKGLVHRDLKPSNLFVTVGPDGAPLIKVLDFGISKAATDGGNPALTRTGAMMGSPSYMSPEQIRSARDADPRSDIWSLGVILYELLSGCLPFAGQSMGEMFASILGSPPASLRERVPEIPQQLDWIILHCLQRDVEQRIPDVAILALALSPFASPRFQPLAERIEGTFQRAGVPGTVRSREERDAELNAISIPSVPMNASALHVSAPYTGPGLPRSGILRSGSARMDSLRSATLPSPAPPRSNMTVVAIGVVIALLCGGGGWWARHHSSTVQAAQAVEAAPTTAATDAPQDAPSTTASTEARANVVPTVEPATAMAARAPSHSGRVEPHGGRGSRDTPRPSGTTTSTPSEPARGDTTPAQPVQPVRAADAPVDPELNRRD